MRIYECCGERILNAAVALLAIIGPRRAKHSQDRVLVAVGYDGTTLLLSASNRAREELERGTGSHPFADRIKSRWFWPGLHVWEGSVRPCEAFGEDAISRLRALEAWQGGWRRATPEEAQRFAAGLPVWEESDG